MLYTLLCYHDEAVTSAWTEEEDAVVMARLNDVHRKWARHMRPVARLMPTSAATTFRKDEKLIIDGPYAETKEQLLGFYVVDVDGLDQAHAIARDLAEANPGGAYEIRPVMLFYPDGAAIDDGAGS
ncbi:YciI family protein [Amorphus sp. 3PC139-8]|uniref:YciI family protein n=1 Tax=Amorphus sp. 3PC139-8 TaxID=2735676 RepID=UPI00345D6B67